MLVREILGFLLLSNHEREGASLKMFSSSKNPLNQMKQQDSLCKSKYAHPHYVLKSPYL